MLSSQNNLFRCRAGSMGKAIKADRVLQRDGGTISVGAHYLKFAKPPEDLHGGPRWEEKGTTERQE